MMHLLEVRYYVILQLIEKKLVSTKRKAKRSIF
jgi:hypothetical protein